ncbi:MAG: hypothetical protein AAFO95_10075 [Cyanobacteria bacterium J06600_6]
MLAIEKFGIRNLEAKLSEYVNSNKLIAVTKNDKTVGFAQPVSNDKPEIALMLEQVNSKLQELRKPKS